MSSHKWNKKYRKIPFLFQKPEKLLFDVCLRSQQSWWSSYFLLQGFFSKVKVKLYIHLKKKSLSNREFFISRYKNFLQEIGGRCTMSWPQRYQTSASLHSDCNSIDTEHSSISRDILLKWNQYGNKIVTTLAL